MTLTERLSNIEQCIEELESQEIQNEITKIYIKRLELSKHYLALHYFYHLAVIKKEESEILKAIDILKDSVKNGKYEYIHASLYKDYLSWDTHQSSKDVYYKQKAKLGILEKIHKKKIESKLELELNIKDYEMYCTLKQHKRFDLVHSYGAFSSKELGQAVANKLKMTILYQGYRG